MENYSLTECHRANKKGGGICLFVRDDLVFASRTDLSKFDNFVESLFIELEIPYVKTKVVVGIVYRPPCGDVHEFNEYIYDTMCAINNEKKDCFILGDFNINILNEKSSEFINHVISCGFSPTITRPTRISKNSSTLIDNILTNTLLSTCYTLGSSGILPTDLSDHFPIFIKGSSKSTQPVSNGNLLTKRRNFSRNNTAKFIKRISDTKWQQVMNENDTNMAYNAFCDAFTKVHNECFPLENTKSKKSKTNTRSPWITVGLLKSIKTKNRLYRKFKKDPSMQKKAEYSRYRNKLNHLLRVSKKQYYHKQFDDNKDSVKGTWGIINNILGRNKPGRHPDTIVTEQYGPVTDDYLKADEFNNYFVNIGPSLAKDIKTTVPVEANTHTESLNPASLFLFPVTENEVAKIASRSLKSNKSAGFDLFRPGIVKQVIPFILKPLTHIFNLSLASGIFPDQLKIAKVIPIFKQGEPVSVSNYRPISVLSCFPNYLND